MRALYDGIQRFLDDVDPVILSRGQDYYLLPDTVRRYMVCVPP